MNDNYFLFSVGSQEIGRMRNERMSDSKKRVQGTCAFSAMKKHSLSAIFERSSKHTVRPGETDERETPNIVRKQSQIKHSTRKHTTFDKKNEIFWRQAKK